jgi:hypothetical protein
MILRESASPSRVVVVAIGAVAVDELAPSRMFNLPF